MHLAVKVLKIVTETPIAVIGTGNYIIYDLNQRINATEFPLPCHFALADSKDASDTFVGGSYMMVSTEGLAVTRSLGTSSTTQVQTTMTLNSASTIAVSTLTSSATATSLPSHQPIENYHRVASLSGGRLAVAIILPVLGSAALIFFACRIWKKRKLRKQILSASPGMQNRHESDSDAIYEIETSHNGPELCGSNVPVLVSQGRHELQGAAMEKKGSAVDTIRNCDVPGLPGCRAAVSVVTF